MKDYVKMYMAMNLTRSIKVIGLRWIEEKMVIEKLGVK